MSDIEDQTIIDRTVQIVSAFVSNNSVPAAELASLIATAHAALTQLTNGTIPPEPEVELIPAVAVRKSVHEDYIICLEDGKKFKSLKRHLYTHYQLTPEAYREKWKLPREYPMVAPGYAKQRSELAKKIGLGSSTRPKPPTRGRKKVA